MAATDQANKAWRALVKSTAETARWWAVSMGGNTPLALIAKMLGEIVEPTEETRSATETKSGTPHLPERL